MPALFFDIDANFAKGQLPATYNAAATTVVLDSVIAGVGTVTTNGTTTLTGVGTVFLNTFQPGDTITVQGETIRTIASVPGDGTLTVTVAFITSVSGLAYVVGGGARFPDPAVPTNGPYNCVWWDKKTYPDPDDDPNKEIVRVTAKTGDTLTITRAQENTLATTKNSFGGIYAISNVLTKFVMDQIRAALGTGGSAHIIADNGAIMPQEPELNFVNFFTLTDVPSVSTDVDIDIPGLVTAINLTGTITVVPDGTTITGDGTPGNPLVAAAGTQADWVATSGPSQINNLYITQIASANIPGSLTASTPEVNWVTIDDGTNNVVSLALFNTLEYDEIILAPDLGTTVTIAGVGGNISLMNGALAITLNGALREYISVRYDPLTTNYIQTGGKKGVVVDGITITGDGTVGNPLVAVGGGGGGGASGFIDQTPDNGTYGLLVGAVDGLNTTFTVSQGSYSSGSLSVFRNGLILLQGAADDWQETAPGAGTFNFNTAPLAGNVITVVYSVTTPSPQVGIQFDDETGAPLGAAGTVDEVEVTGTGVTGVRVGNKVTYTIAGGGGGSLQIDQTPDNGTYGLLGGAVDGLNTTFTVSLSAYTSGKLQVYRNGFIQLQGGADDWVETTPASGTFDFNTAPVTGDIITVVYSISGSGGSTPFSINQTGHPFIVGDIIRPDINQWTFSQSNNAANAETWAQVTVIIDPNNFTALPLVGTRQQDAGIVALIGAFAGGDSLYVDETTPGAFTNVAPVTIGAVTKPIGYVEADAGGVPISLLTVNYRGQLNQGVVISNGLLHSFADSSFTVPPNTTPIIIDTYTIPANTFVVGDSIRITLGTSVVTNGGNAGTNDIEIGGVSILAYGSPATGALYNITTILTGVIKATTIEFSEISMRDISSSYDIYRVISRSFSFDSTISNILTAVITSGTMLGGYSGSFNNLEIEKV